MKMWWKVSQYFFKIWQKILNRKYFGFHCHNVKSHTKQRLWTKYSNILYYIRVKNTCVSFSLNYCKFIIGRWYKGGPLKEAFVTLWTWLEHEGLMTQLLSSTVYIDGQTCMWCLPSLLCLCPHSSTSLTKS